MKKHSAMLTVLAVLGSALLLGACRGVVYIDPPIDSFPDGGESEASHEKREGEPEFTESTDYYSGISARGYLLDTEQCLLTVAMGERNTGGYGIHIVSMLLSEDGKTLTVTVEETSPRPDWNVTMAFTQPAVTVQLPFVPEELTVTDASGYLYRELASDTDYQKNAPNSDIE